MKKQSKQTPQAVAPKPTRAEQLNSYASALYFMLGEPVMRLAGAKEEVARDLLRSERASMVCADAVTDLAQMEGAANVSEDIWRVIVAVGPETPEAVLVILKDFQVKTTERLIDEVTYLSSGYSDPARHLAEHMNMQGRGKWLHNGWGGLPSMIHLTESTIKSLAQEG